MNISFIPKEWNTVDHLSYVIELVKSMDLTPKQRADVVREWGAGFGIVVEVEEIGGQE